MESDGAAGGVLCSFVKEKYSCFKGLSGDASLPESSLEFSLSFPQSFPPPPQWHGSLRGSFLERFVAVNSVHSVFCPGARMSLWLPRTARHLSGEITSHLSAARGTGVPRGAINIHRLVSRASFPHPSYHRITRRQICFPRALRPRQNSARFPARQQEIEMIGAAVSCSRPDLYGRLALPPPPREKLPRRRQESRALRIGFAACACK
ncbi:hypothetical protein E2C01_056724 [Portunus trituberculatus]|uniref:Uncharacterized protein n=1 Tax=Portunus trituberculatus TaxID=210409 RepID=A0A5B7GZ02_PORTR|nr:hypothetical protein [Portunus trituberculatus]